MDPNSADPTSRPAPPGARRRASKKPDHDLGDHNDVTHDVGMSSSTTQDTIRPSISLSTSHSLSREEIDDAIKGLTRDDLFLALTRAKEEMDRLDSVVSSQTLQIEGLLSNNADLAARLQSSDSQIEKAALLVSQREARVDEMAYEQEKMEDEIFKKIGTLERLKSKASEAERRLEEAEKKAAALSQAADKEREYYQNQEALLTSQNTRLTKDNQGLKEEVAHLRDTVDSLIEQQEEQQQQQQQEQQQDQTDHLRDPAGSVSTPANPSSPLPPTTPRRSGRKSNASLHYASPSAIAMRTLASETTSSSAADDVAALRDELEQLKKTLSSQDAALSEVRNSLNSERARTTELTTEKQELESMLTGNTLEQLVRGKANGRWKSNSESNSSASVYTDSVISEEDEDTDTDASASGSGSVNADEDVDDVDDLPITPKAPTSSSRGPRTSAHIRRKRSVNHMPDALGNELDGDTGSNIRELQEELRHLRTENKSLSTYISKILNRILSMEGFERVLAQDSLDAANGGSIRGAQRKRAPRHSVLPVVSTPSEEARKDRRKSAGGILGFGAGAPTTRASPDSDPAQQQPPRRTSRTASVDWRNIKLPWTSPSPSDDRASNPNLRPFALSSQSASGMEDDNDEAERQKARTMLQLSGHTVPDHQLASPKISSNAPLSPSTVGGSSFGALFSRVLGSTTQPDANAPSDTISSPTISSPIESNTEEPLTEFTSRSKRPSRPTRPTINSGIGIEFPASASAADESRGESVAGDESYAIESASPVVESSTAVGTGWKRAFKRMSLLAGERPDTSTTQQQQQQQ
ncbi:unnamed protein product [Sympodiomycopsis kandeliae]